jgi:glycerol-3-phosphate acyltransferase PlsX
LTSTPRIALDGLGGEVVPSECLAALSEFLNQNQKAVVCLATTSEHFQKIQSELDSKYHSRCEWIPADNCIEFDESPVAAIKNKKNSSIAVATDALHKEEVQALVSFGHTGAAVAAARLKLGLIEGVSCAGLAAIIPNKHGFGLLMDVGANLVCRPEQLYQFALMADVYSKKSLGIPSPRIGLLNIGSEASKGDASLQATRELFEKADFNFLGNVEGGQIFDGAADVVVCSGMIGNMILKSAESLANMLFESLVEKLKHSGDHWSNARTRWVISSLASKHDPDSRGASRLLGVRGLVLIGHGNARREAICSALHRASDEIELGLQAAMQVRLTHQ